MRHQAALYLVATLATVTLSVYFFSRRPVTSMTVIIGLFYVALVPSLMKNRSQIDDNAPNVYFLMPDSYTSSDAYSKYFNHDNSTFVSFLRENEFHISDTVYVNYPVTTLAVSSMLEANLFVTSGDEVFIQPENYEPVYQRLRGNNRSSKIFRSEGYNFIQYFPGVGCHALVTHCLAEERSYSHSTKEFMRLTPLEAVIDGFNIKIFGFEKSKFRQTMHDIQFIQKFVTEDYKSQKPFFLFARILPPHDGNSYNKDCSFKEQGSGKDKTGFAGANAFDMNTFKSDTKCVEKDLQKLVLQIQKMDPSAIIIIQSDGGPDYLNQFDKPFQSWTEVEVYSRYSAFRAVKSNEKYKNCIDANIKKTITTVNTLGIVTSCMFKKRLNLANDHSFFASYPGRIDHGIVKMILNGGDLIQAR